MNKVTLYAIADPAPGLLVYCTDCDPGGNGRLVVRRNGSWQAVHTTCLIPGIPVAGTHSATYNSVTWQWNPAPGAVSYRFGSSSDYANSWDQDTATQYSETGLVCNWLYTRYVWAVNACGHSDSLVLTQLTPQCPWSCGQNITDPRDSKVYGTVQIGNQCWFRDGLNYGTRISGTQSPSNNNIVEKYCYLDNDLNCSTYGGMYRWGEVVQYLNGASDESNWEPTPSFPVQGICPSGWHLPSKEEYNTLIDYLGGTSFAGGAMKSMSAQWNPPNTGASNSSGFSGLPGGYRHSNGSFYNFGSDVSFWTSTPDEPNYTQAYLVPLSYISVGTYTTVGNKSYGNYLRCLKND
jgi:uncharacterized protein (TIGR02145 family)